VRVAVVSDVHSNWEALSVVLGHVSYQDVAQIWCLGDLVGYNADPDACVEAIRQSCSIVIGGNHDGAVAGNFEPDYFNSVAREAVMWTRRVMKRDNLNYLKRLGSARAVDQHVLLVHGAPTDPDVYVFGAEQAMEELEFLERTLKKRICFFGHTHVPVMYSKDERGRFRSSEGEGKIRLSPNEFYLINPGSVGQPRDGDPRASYLIFDFEEFSVEWFRLSYDIPACQDKILEAGLPEFLAQRLARGC